MVRIDIPVLHTPRLILRGFRDSDLDRLAAMQADPEVMRHLGRGAARGRPRSRGESFDTILTVLGLWALRGYGLFAVDERASGRLVGRVGIIHPYDWPGPELAWTLDRAFWGQGYAVEAVAAARDWAFAGFAFPRLPSFIRPGNERSARTAARLGAVREGMIELEGEPVEHWLHYPPNAGPVV